MKLLFAPKPVLNSKMEVMFYCIRFQKADKYLSNQPLWLMDGAMHSPCLDILEMVGIEGLSNGMPIFIPLNKLSLLIDIENRCHENHEKIIFLLDEDTTPEDAFVDNIKRLKDLGYRFALENISKIELMTPIIELCDYFFINCATDGFVNNFKDLSRKFRNISFIAANVTDTDLFKRISRSGFDFFEGKFYSKPILKEHNAVVPIKVNRIQLLNIVRNEEFEIEEVVKVVGQDPSLSISLLKFVNSPYLGITQKINTISHAVAMLGQTEVRKWVTTATSGVLAEDKPDEVTKLSLMRAKFAENLARHFEMAIHANSLFIMGLFSVMDVILEMPMSEALKIVTVSDSIQRALLLMEGEFSPVLDFIYKYEAADWNDVHRLMILHNIDVQDVFNAYIDSAKWYASIVSAEVDESGEKPADKNGEA